MKLFVYGTLKKDKPNHFMMKTATFLGEYSTEKGYSLRILKNGLPILLHDGKGPGCVGELYEVDPTLLKRLDVFEGHPHMYERQKIAVYSTDAGVFADGVESYVFPYHPRLDKFEMKGSY